MKEVLTIGSAGMVGSRFVELSSDSFKFLTPSIKDLDITKETEVEKYFGKNEKAFDVVVNFAAFTDVGAAEKESGDENGLSWKLNALAPKYLAKESKKYGKYFIHFSTDFVFEGLEASKGPFEEDQELPDLPDDLCWYGWTKNVGEKNILKTDSRHAIVRIANPFRTHFDIKADIARNILTLYDQKKLYPLFTDQIITPIFIDSMVIPLSKLIEDEINGTFHFASKDSTSYYGFGEYLLEKARGVKNAPEKSSLVEFLKTPGRNKRPLFGGLSVKETENVLGIKFSSWKEMVDDFVGQLDITS